MVEGVEAASQPSQPDQSIAKETLLEILQATPDFVAMADENGEMLFMNAGARQMVGLPPSSDELGFEIPAEARQAGTYRRPEWAKRKVLEEGFPTARRQGIWRGETALYDADGNEVPISHIVLAHFDNAGRAVRFSTIMRDISAEKRQERALAVYQAVFQDCRDAILLLDTAGTIVEANPAAFELFASPGADPLVDAALAKFVPREASGGAPASDLVQDQIGRTRKRGSAFFETRLAGLDGRDFPAAVQLSRVVSETTTRIVAIVRDITARQERYEAIFNQTYQFTGLMAPDGTVLEANATALQFGGLKRRDVVGRYLWETPWFQNAPDPESELRAVVGRAAAGEFVRYEREVQGAQGPLVIDFSLRPVFDEQGRVSLIIPEGRDITDLVSARRQLQDMAYRDQVTGLPNRRAYHDQIAELVASAKAGGDRFAVLVVKMERFHDVVRDFGHKVADDVVRAFAARTQASLPQDTFFAYVGEAEFAIVLPRLTNAGQARRCANRVWQELQVPLGVQGAQIHRQAWIGIARYPDHGRTSEELLRQGEVAIDAGRDCDGGGVWYAESARADRAPQRLALVSRLRSALAEGRFNVHYQPVLAPGSGALLGLEALARWYESDRGWIPPTDFVPLAVETGLARQLGEYVLHRVLADLASWQQAGLAVPRVALNVTRQDLRDPVFTTQLLAGLRDHGVPPHRLELDVAESLLAEDPDRPSHALAQMRRSGIAVAIDDFGTGACALAKLPALPADRVKVAQTIVRDLPDTRANRALLDSIARLAAGLGLDLVGKGVESDGERQLLAELGVAACQGYHLAAPQPAADVRAYLQPDSG